MPHGDVRGTVHVADLTGGRLRYYERGDGPPVLFVHGLLVNSNLWRKVIPAVADAGFRCVAPDWPLGSHEIPVPDAELSPPGVAAMIAEFLERRDLRDVTVVANDTGGGLTQIMLASSPDRVGRVVLTPSDSFEHFFPPLFRPLSVLARLPGSMPLLTTAMRVRALHRLPIAFGWLTKRPVPPEVVDSYLKPSRHSAAIRDDLRRFLRGVHNRYTLAAADALSGFPKPVLLAWAKQDRVFPLSLAHRLASVLSDARVETIEDSYTFVPEDQPEALARLVIDFAKSR